MDPHFLKVFSVVKEFGQYHITCCGINVYTLYPIDPSLQTICGLQVAAEKMTNGESRDSVIKWYEETYPEATAHLSYLPPEEILEPLVVMRKK